MIDNQSINALAFLMTKLRPEWDAPGCVAALRKVDVPLSQLLIAVAKYAADPGNLTPAHIADFGNRAWVTDSFLPCRTHGAASRRLDGECAGCFAERTEAREKPQRRPSPPPAPLRELVAASRPSHATESDR